MKLAYRLARVILCDSVRCLAECSGSAGWAFVGRPSECTCLVPPLGALRTAQAAWLRRRVPSLSQAFQPLRSCHSIARSFVTLQSLEMKIERPNLHGRPASRTQLGTVALALEVHHSGLPGSGAIARAQNWWIAAQRYLERQHVVQRPRPCAQTPWLVPPEQPEFRRSGRPPAAS
eukprot:COSAG06_NODE_903_length_11646_cov_15.420975_2_plen_175_part_00